MLRDMKPPLQVQLRRFGRRPNCKLVPCVGVMNLTATGDVTAAAPSVMTRLANVASIAATTTQTKRRQINEL